MSVSNSCENIQKCKRRIPARAVKNFYLIRVFEVTWIRGCGIALHLKDNVYFSFILKVSAANFHLCKLRLACCNPHVEVMNSECRLVELSRNVPKLKAIHHKVLSLSILSALREIIFSQTYFFTLISRKKLLSEKLLAYFLGGVFNIPMNMYVILLSVLWQAAEELQDFSASSLFCIFLLLKRRCRPDEILRMSNSGIINAVLHLR